jgi:hypothetical protein
LLKDSFSCCFADLKAEATEELAWLKVRTPGKVSTFRWASSHLLMSYQLKEVARLRRVLKSRPTSVSAARPRKVALEVARSHSLHESAMAVILAADGEPMLEIMEKKRDGYSYYEKRREALKKELKKARVDSAILKGGVAAAIVTRAPPAAKQGGGGGSGGGGGGGNASGGGGGGGQPKGVQRDNRPRGGKKVAKAKAKAKQSGEEPKPLTCFDCGGLGHINRNCPRNR